jgi:hypothetical protein
MGKEKTKEDYEKLGREMENIMLLGYSNTKRVIWVIFLKGIVYGVGLFIGGTIVVALVLWILGFFDDVPLIGPIVQKIVDTTVTVKP